MEPTQTSGSALIVEDDDRVAYLLEYMLRRQGFEVLRVADGKKAAERIADGPPVDVVILDIMLPYLDGYELIGLIRAHPDWRTVPVIVVSGRNQEQDVVRALRSGADDYVLKPYRPAELMARINLRIATARHLHDF